MKLQSQISRKLKNKEYIKYIVVLPKIQIKKLNWTKGTELISKVVGDELIIEAKYKNN